MIPIPGQGAEVYRVKRSGETLSHPKSRVPNRPQPRLSPQATPENSSQDSTEQASQPMVYGWQQDQRTTRPTLPESIVDPSQFIDHSVFGEVLHKVVNKHGWVDYRKLKRDKSLQRKLKAYVEDLSKIDPNTLEDPRDRLAGWLNLYNAIVLQEVLQHYPIKRVNQVPHFFDQAKHKIGEKTYSLLDIEQSIFLESLQEPRAVFARVTGTTSGPRLRQTPYHPLKLEEQLEDQTWKFLLNKENVDYNPKRNLLTLNSLLLWYEKELGNSIAFLRTYLDLLPPLFNIAYRGYDWTLNDEKLH